MLERGTPKNPGVIVILIFVTCGIYNIVYLYQLMVDLNKGLGRNEFNPIVELLLVFVTCGLWQFYLYWRISKAIETIEDNWQVKHFLDTPVMYIANIFFWCLAAQVALNEVWSHGVQPNAGELPPSPVDNLLDPDLEDQERAARYQEELKSFDEALGKGEDGQL